MFLDKGIIPVSQKILVGNNKLEFESTFQKI